MFFTEIASLLAIAAVGGIFAKIFKQPILIGYLFAGIVLSMMGVVGSHEIIDGMGKIGVALLLFLVGLEMDMRELKTLGKVAVITGLSQILFTSGVGFLIAILLGFSITASIYIAIALTFSSTIIIVKLLSEKGDLGSLYGKIAIGFLLVQDFVAVLLLMFLSGLGASAITAGSFLIIVVKAALLFTATWVLSKKTLPFIFGKILHASPELLFISSIAWALGVSALVGGPLGFSFEIGGFLAGLALSGLPEHLGVSSKTRPLRDFFLTIFFLYLGTQLVVGDFFSILLPAVVFSVFVLIGNPVIVMIVMGLMRYKKRTSFLASVTVAQISEFSFVLMAMGAFLGHVSQQEVAMVIVVGVVTMTISTYMILGSNKIYTKLKGLLSVFERKKTHEEVFIKAGEYSDHIVLLGSNRMGSTLLKFFKRKKLPVLVIDHDPKVFRMLTAINTPVLLGDIEDTDVMEVAQIEKAALLISSIPYLQDNLVALEYIKKLPRKPAVIMKAQSREDAIRLYEAGANFVLVPDIVAGEFLRHVFLSHGISSERIRKMGEGHFKRLL